MIAAKQIQYLRQSDIDKLKWDRCIQSVNDGLVYNYSWCLDIMCPQWDGLVLNDYEAVMPLTWKKKYGIAYLYQPFFVAQSGITAKTSSSALTDAFISAVPARFKFIDIDLHETNDTAQYTSFCHRRVNLLLDTRLDYKIVSGEYHRLANRMIRKAAAAEVVVETGNDIAASIDFYRNHYQLKGVRQRDYDRLITMLNKALENDQLVSLVAKKSGVLLAVYLLLKDDHYVYSVIGGSSPEGKEYAAFYLLTDYAIKLICGTGRQFRFEGSDLPGIANFNRQFGATPVYYNHLALNRLPFPLNLLKK